MVGGIPYQSQNARRSKVRRAFSYAMISNCCTVPATPFSLR